MRSINLYVTGLIERSSFHEQVLLEVLLEKGVSLKL